MVALNAVLVMPWRNRIQAFHARARPAAEGTPLLAAAVFGSGGSRAQTAAASRDRRRPQTRPQPTASVASPSSASDSCPPHRSLFAVAVAVAVAVARALPARRPAERASRARRTAASRATTTTTAAPHRCSAPAACTPRGPSGAAGAGRLTAPGAKCLAIGDAVARGSTVLFPAKWRRVIQNGDAGEQKSTISVEEGTPPPLAPYFRLLQGALRRLLAAI